MLYIMRHGKTEWNALSKLQGRTDIPLCDEGRMMAKEAAKEYASVNIDVCYCSPLQRAKETAQILLANRNVPIIIDERLIEMSFGEYEGSIDYLGPTDCPINVIFREPAKYKESIGGSETFDELFKRTGEFLAEVIEPELEARKDVLIVGHGAMNLSIICQRKNLPIEEFWSAGLSQCKMMEI